ncbi:hypothetical protein L195_g028664 [Trifolium pratense]|uniref:Uncharacterized protein n=1 Tax=Trifolium pratense TaxID=57577 RepID=A0A2K3L2M1_TRIPR|nr:hypothetical protein L195_g028664 [Trifolium pratense]
MLIKTCSERNNSFDQIKALLVAVMSFRHRGESGPPALLCQQPTPACQLSYPHQDTYLISSLPTGRRFLFPKINEEGRNQLILPKNRKRSAMPGRGDGKRNDSEERNGDSQCFSTPNEMRQP